MTRHCKFTRSLFAAWALWSAAAAWGDESCGDNHLSHITDLSFMCTAAAAGNFELRMSRIAALRANSEVVRQLASNLVEQQSRTRRKLKEIAAARDFTIGDRVDYADAQRLLALQRRVGDEFDREYLTQLVTQDRYIKYLLEQQHQADTTSELRTFIQLQLVAVDGRSSQIQALADQR
jgi:putative membrane protein